MPRQPYTPYKLRISIYVFDTPVSCRRLEIPGIPKSLGSYTQAWDWIEANRDALQLPLGASAVEEYVPTNRSDK